MKNIGTLIIILLIFLTFSTIGLNGFNELIGYSFIALILVLLLYYRSASLTLITSIPIALTGLLTIGVMKLLHLEFNVLNIITSCFIFGFGIYNSIFITHTLRKDYSYGLKRNNTYKIVIISIAILSIGVFIFIKQPDNYPLSIISFIGILLTVIIIFTIQPILFNIFIRNRAKRGYSPIDVALFIRSFFLHSFYALGGIFLSLFSLTILQIIPLSKKMKFKWMHQLVSVFSIQVIRNNFLAKKIIINEMGENFEKPAIVIANHSSSLDTIVLNSITHKLIFMVNNWVYKSPIFGILARVLEYYPASTGIDKGVGHLKKKLHQGYFLCVFPEGKRSFTNKIGRFHKGPFYLQQKLNVDILPIYLHGVSEIMPKGDFMIYSGSITVKIGKRISCDGVEFGKTDRERTKNISTFYKARFLELKNKCEDPNYFKRILYSNYKFKEPDIILLIKQDFENNKNAYHYLNENTPIKSKILHLANDFGQIDILLVSKFIDRKITTFIKDKKKRSIAINCYTNTHRNVNYISDIETQDFNNFETLLLTDSLSANLIDISKLSHFKNIILAKKSYSVEKIVAAGFKIKMEKNLITIFEKN